MITMTTATLLLRLEGPTQAWGPAGARWEQRPTLTRPTKSGVLGLIANALGRDYRDDPSDLAALRFAARADRPGLILRDYQAVGGGRFPLDAATVLHNPVLAKHPDRFAYGAPRDPKIEDDGTRTGTWGAERDRQGLIKEAGLLVDAGFLVSLTGDAALLDQAYAAVTEPARLLSLGRRHSPPARPLAHQILDGDQHHGWVHEVPLLDTATTRQPLCWHEQSPTEPGGQVVYEQPTGHREFGPVLITTSTSTPPESEENAA